MTTRPNKISFEALMHADLPMMGQWQRQPHNQKWSGDPETELDYIHDMLEGRDTTRPYIFQIQGKPMGYIQVWFIGHHQSAQWISGRPWLASLPSDAVGVDLSIGDPNALSKGWGSKVLAAFTAKLVDEGYQTIIIDPDPNNHRAVRAYSKAGYAPIPALLGKTPAETLIMKFDTTQGQPTP